MKKNNLYCFIAVAALMALTACGGGKTAQNANDDEASDSTEQAASSYEATGELGLFELRGPVKSCKLTARWGNTITRTFDEKGMWLTIDGKKISSFYGHGIKRDDKGRIVSGMMDSAENKEEYTYNDNGTVAKYSLAYYDTTEEDEYTYDSDGNLVSKHVEEGGMEAEDPYTETYEVVESDSHGNWTKRTVTVGGQKSTETRQITYYE